MIISNGKGPAEAATSPSLGSNETQAGVKMNNRDNSTAAPALATETAEERDVHRLIFDAGNSLDMARNILQLVFMTSEALVRTDRKTANALTAGCDLVDDILSQITHLLEVAQEKARAAR